MMIKNKDQHVKKNYHCESSFIVEPKNITLYSTAKLFNSTFAGSIVLLKLA